MRSFFPLIACVVLLMAGCKQDGSTRPSDSVPISIELKARLEAAKAITFSTDRDQALSAVARDAAKAGDATVTKAALGSINFTAVKDETAADCALKLAAAKQGTAANEVANMISFTTIRDATLKKLASGGY
jgi:hypothetical protein